MTDNLPDLLAAHEAAANEALAAIADLRLHIEAKRAEILIEALDAFEPDRFDA